MGKRTQNAKQARWQQLAKNLVTAVTENTADCFSQMYHVIHLEHPSVYENAYAQIVELEDPGLKSSFLEIAEEAASFNKFSLSETEAIYQHQFSIPVFFETPQPTGSILTTVRLENITERLKELLNSKVPGEWGVGIIPVLFSVDAIEKLTPLEIAKRGSVFYEVSRRSFNADISKDYAFLEGLQVGGAHVKGPKDSVVMLTGSFYLRDTNGGKLGDLLESMSQEPLAKTELTALFESAFETPGTVVGLAPLKEGAKLGRLSLIGLDTGRFLNSIPNEKSSLFGYVSLSMNSDNTIWLKLAFVAQEARELVGGLAWKIGSLQDIPLILSVIRGVLEESHIQDIFGKEELCTFGSEVKGPALGEILVPLI